MYRDVNVPIAVGARNADLRCTVCIERNGEAVLLEWIPQVGRMDAYEPFQEFTVDVNGRQERVESLRKLREIERTSEQQARNGEGQPLVWRDYSQDRSNFDQHAIAKHVNRAVADQDSPFRVDAKKYVPARGEAVTAKHGTVD